MFLAADDDIYAAGILFDNVIFPSYVAFTPSGIPENIPLPQGEQINLP